MRGQPALYPDMNVWEGDPPISWPVNVRHNGQPLDLTGRLLTVPVFDDGEQVGELQLEMVNTLKGKTSVTLTQELFDQLRHYSTWQLKEKTDFSAPLVQGRIVRGG